MTKMKFLTLLLLIVGLSANAAGQEKPSWIARLETLLREKERAWKIAEKDARGAGKYYHETIILKSGALRADISIDVLDSEEMAKEQFDGEEIAFTNILGKGSVKSELENLGDENFMFTGRRGPRRRGNIFLRRGNVLVKVFAPSAKTAERLARHVVGQMPPPD